MADATATTGSGRALRPRQARGGSMSNQTAGATGDGSAARRTARGARDATVSTSTRGASARRGLGEAVSVRARPVAHATVPQHIITFMAAPKLEDVSHDSLTRWMDLRLEYEETIRARCKNSGESVDSLMVSVRNSFDEAYLDTLCEIEWNIDKKELTDEFLWDWIKSTVETFKNQVLPDIEGLFQRELRFDTSSTDVKAQVTNYFHLCNTIIRTNGLVSLFRDKDEKKCKILVKCLPAKLQKRVKNELDFHDSNPKASVPALFQLVLKLALEQAREDHVLRQLKRQRDDDEHSPPAKRQQRRGGRPGDGDVPRGGKVRYQQGSNMGKRVPHSKHGDLQPSTGATTGSDWDGVLHSKGCYGCGGDHALLGCTVLNAGAKKKVGLALREKHEKGRQRQDPTH